MVTRILLWLARLCALQCLTRDFISVSTSVYCTRCPACGIWSFGDLSRFCVAQFGAHWSDCMLCTLPLSKSCIASHAVYLQVHCASHAVQINKPMHTVQVAHEGRAWLEPCANLQRTLRDVCSAKLHRKQACVQARLVLMLVLARGSAAKAGWAVYKG